MLKKKDLEIKEIAKKRFEELEPIILREKGNFNQFVNADIFDSCISFILASLGMSY